MHREDTVRINRVWYRVMEKKLLWGPRLIFGLKERQRLNPSAPNHYSSLELETSSISTKQTQNLSKQKCTPNTLRRVNRNKT